MFKLSFCNDMLNWGKDIESSISNLITDGADAVEFWKWSDKNISIIKQFVEEKKLIISGFCLDSSDEKISSLCFGNIMSGGFVDEFLIAVRESIAVAKQLNAKSLIATVGDNVDGLSISEQISNIKKCINASLTLFEESEITLLLEPICRAERPGYLIPEADKMIDIIKEIDSDYVKLLYDIFHQSNTGDYSADFIAENIQYIGHIHLADVPGRHEPGSGNINFKNLLTKLYSSGYNRYVGLEYSADKKSVKETIQYLNNLL